MPERVVAVSLTAYVANYVAGMEEARRATDKTRTAAELARAKFEEQNLAMSRVGSGLLAVGALAAVGVGLAIKKWADFDEAISHVQAATHATNDEMSLLREAALEAGARTVYSATEAANAIEELGKAGLSTREILEGGLDASLDLAAASGIAVADAAGIAATALKVFKLEGEEMAHVSDLMAAAAGKAMGGVSDMGQALAQAGQVSASTGLSIDETTAALAAFAAQGLLGSDAGTAFKSMLQRLTPQSAEAEGLMRDLGISAYDAQGSFIGLAEFAGVLQKALKDKTTEERNSALATIFGSDAVRAATVLYSEGAEGIRDWTSKVDDSGYAAETAAMRLDNLKGDVEKLSGAFDTALISSGEAADGVLRALTQTATAVVDAFNDAPPIVQQAALALGAFVAVGALVGGTMLVAVPKIAEFQLALRTLAASDMPAVSVAATRMSRAVSLGTAAMSKSAAFLAGPWGIALAAASVGVTLLFDAVEAGQTSTNEFTNALERSASAAELLRLAAKADPATTAFFGDYNDSLQNLPELLTKANGAANTFLGFMSLSTNELGAVDALDRLGDNLATLAAKDLPGAQRAFRDLASEYNLNAEEQGYLLEAMPGLRDALVEQATALGINVTSADAAANKTALLELAMGDATPTALDAAEAYLAAADEAQGLNDQVNALIDAINKANGVGQDAVSANASYRQSLADISAEVKAQQDAFAEANGSLDGFYLSLDQTTAAGASNADMLAQIAGKAQDAAAAQYEVDKTTMSAKDATDKYVSALSDGRQALIDQATANGFNADEVQRLVDNVYKLPNQVETKALLDTAQVYERLQAIQSSFAAFEASGLNLTAYIRTVDRKADGGPITGVGGPREDNIPIMASAGEHMLSARDVQQLGGHAGVFALRRSLYQGLADGGPVQPLYAPPIYVREPMRVSIPADALSASGAKAGDRTFNLTVQNPIHKDLLETVSEHAESIVEGSW